MSLSSIQNTPASIGIGPFHRAPKRFAFEKWLWFPALIFAANIRGAFAALLDKPIPKWVRPPICDPSPQNTTTIWTNEIGQYTLNVKDPQGSYQSYAEAFQTPLSEWVKEMNEIASGSSNLAEKMQANSLTTCKEDCAPQELELNGFFKNSDKYFPSEATVTFSPPYELEESRGLSTLTKKVLQIIRKWHPHDEIKIHQLGVADASLGDKYRNLTLHLDDLYHAGLTVPANEYPLIKGELWITKSGDWARLEHIRQTKDEVEVTLLDNPESISGKAVTLKKSDLDYHACVSGKTTPIVPGLGYQQTPNGVFDQRLLIHSNSSMRKSATKLLKYAVQLPIQSSLLFPGAKLVHGIPFYHEEPSSQATQNCTQIYRKRLAVFYERNSKVSCSAGLIESVQRLTFFLNRFILPIIDAACILVFLFAARLLTRPTE